MSTTKIAISIDKKLLSELDNMVVLKNFPSRSNAIQQAVEDKLSRIKKYRLFIECSKLDYKEEMESANEVIQGEREQWQKY